MVSTLKPKSINGTLQRLILALLIFIVAVLWTDLFTRLSLPRVPPIFHPLFMKALYFLKKGHHSPKSTVSRTKIIRSPATPK